MVKEKSTKPLSALYLRVTLLLKINLAGSTVIRRLCVPCVPLHHAPVQTHPAFDFVKAVGGQLAKHISSLLCSWLGVVADKASQALLMALVRHTAPSQGSTVIDRG